MKTKRTFSAKAQRFVCGLFAAVALLFTGCNNDDNDPNAEPTISISPSMDAITFSAEAGESYSFKITTNQPVWLAGSDQEWCVVTMDAYNNSFTVTALPNTSSTPPPAATITVSAGSLNKLTITATQVGITESDVYVSGYCANERYDTYACYWKNNVLTKLNAPAGNTFYSGTSIAVGGNSLYIGGFIKDAGCYWKDGQFFEMADAQLSYVNSIAVEGDNIYMCGPDFYWNGSESVPTPRVDNGSFNANALAVSGGSAYIVGHTYLSLPIIGSSVQQASYWSGKSSESSEPLSTPSTSTHAEATCVFALGNSFYAGGYFVDKENVQIPCYWKDGSCTTLDVPAGMITNSVGGICVANGIVYVAGSCENDESAIACYWADGRRVELPLPPGANMITITGIAVAGGKICVSGQYLDSTDERHSCYWVNGERTELVKGESSERAFATGIALIVK